MSKLHRKLATATLLCLAGLLILAVASAEEVPIDTVIKSAKHDGLQILVEIEAAEPMLPAGRHLSESEATHHVEAMVTFAAENPYGELEDSFFPYLRISATLKHVGSGKTVDTSLVPLASGGGFHYGNNVRLEERGTYQFRLLVSPPDDDSVARHEDVPVWFEPFDMSFSFEY